MKNLTLITILSFFTMLAYSGDENVRAVQDINKYIQQLKTCSVTVNYERTLIREYESAQEKSQYEKKIYEKIHDGEINEEKWEIDPEKNKILKNKHKDDEENYRLIKKQNLNCKYSFEHNTISELLYKNDQLVYGNIVKPNQLIQHDNVRQTFGNNKDKNEPVTKTIKQRERWEYLGILKWAKHFDPEMENAKSTTHTDDGSIEFVFDDENQTIFVARRISDEAGYLPVNYSYISGRTKNVYSFNDYVKIDGLFVPSKVTLQSIKTTDDVLPGSYRMIYELKK